MGREEQITDERKRKLEQLRKAEINPYPTRFDKKHTCLQALKSKLGAKVITAGRLIRKRNLGKITFCVLRDETSDIQIVFQAGETPKKTFEFFDKFFDSGDIIGIFGKVIKTKTGEISILVDKVEMLSKSVLPLPEKFHGLQDEDDRLRKRYLDIAMNPEIREMFVRKSKFWQTTREFLLDKGFLEVDTPVLENVPGGAEAKPFITHHNALNTDVYLRISDELWLKRLVVAGYPKVFEIGRIFRNEGMDAEHLQDYTQVEFYWAYADYNDGMKLVEEMYKKIAKDVFGTLKFKIREFTVDFSKKWEIYDYVAIIKKMTGIDVLKADLNQMEKKLKELKVDYDKKGLNRNRAMDNLWKYCRKKISGPGFLINVPVELEPLAKKSEKNPRVVERFQIILAGSEIGKGFSELNDPLDQMNRFEYQKKLREQGDEEAQRMDKDYVEALKHGMPPAFGFGVSERLFSFLENKPIRETVIFPLMKPEK
ncbi:lysine--tRNA ligase [Candidatus Pacearchaeota archaeon]|nr:lysine--tRNA ligase [Candidatus Pacearchaeota archaeon]